jgi:hypothetical protein
MIHRPIHWALQLAFALLVALYIYQDVQVKRKYVRLCRADIQVLYHNAYIDGSNAGMRYAEAQNDNTRTMGYHATQYDKQYRADSTQFAKHLNTIWK